MRPILLAALASCAAPAFAQEAPLLTVYTYDSFVSDYGPGPVVEAEFEQVCGCDLRFVAAGDGAALLGRLKLEGRRSDADVVVGLDTALMADAAETGLFAPHGHTDLALDLPVPWENDTFVPYDWGWFAFVHDRERLPEPPGSFRALADSDVSILIQDPRSSTPGLGLVLWVKAAYGDAAEALWRDLADNVVTVTPGWSEAYGLFLEGEADMVLSYTTSPAYHIVAENDPTMAAAPFAEGHYLQVEVAAKLASSDVPDLADEFLRFLLSPPVQSVIPTTNWMYPAAPEVPLPDAFDTLVTPEMSLLSDPEEARAVRDEAVAEWKRGLSR